MDNQDEKDPKNWAFGSFYYNKNDKRIWINRNKGYGTTLNMANKNSYVILAAILIPPFFVILAVFIVALLAE